MSDEEYLQNLAKRLGLNEDDMTNIIHCYIEAVTGKFVPLTPWSKPHIDIRPVKLKSLKERLNEAYYQKEDDKMKATSVQNIKNVKDICISAASFPMGGPGETLTIVIYTNDDVFEFNFEGPDLVQKCKKSGLFSGWEKEQKIRVLELEKEGLKKHINNYDSIVARNNELEEENKNLRIQVRVLEDVKKENAELKDKLIKALSIIVDKEEKKDE